MNIFFSGAFLIPYFLMLICGALPVLLLEIGLGQYMSKGGLKSWIICPLFQGLIYVSGEILDLSIPTIIVKTILLQMYFMQRIVCFLGFFFIHLETSPLPMKDCKF